MYNSDFNISAPLSHPRRELGSNTPLKLACRWAQRCVGAALPPLCSGSILWTLSRPRDVAMPPLTLSALLRGQEAQGLSSVTSHSAHILSTFCMPATVLSTSGKKYLIPLPILACHCLLSISQLGKLELKGQGCHPVTSLRWDLNPLLLAPKFLLLWHWCPKLSCLQGTLHTMLLTILNVKRQQFPPLSSSWGFRKS